MTIALFIIGILLIVLNIRAVRKEKKSFGSTLAKADIDMTEVEVAIGRLRREFSETILELQSELMELKETLANKNNTQENLITIEELSKEVEVIEEKVMETGNNVRINEISRLLDENMDIDEVAEKLGIGKGEVLLIKELYLK